MTSKEKANELFNNHFRILTSNSDVKLRGYGIELANQCALITVDEIIESIEFSLLHHLGSQYLIEKLNFWDSVKQELQNL